MQRRSLIQRSTALGAAGLIAASMAACGVESDPGSTTADTTGAGFNLAEGEGTIDLVSIGWDENVVTSNMWKLALEDAGYTVELHEVSEPGVLFQGLADGTYDLFMDGWLPYTHETYWTEHQDSLEDLGTWYEGAALTVAVPAYLEDINTLEDLKENADLFGGTITGIEAGAGLTAAVQDATIPIYGLEDDYELVTSSTAAMLASLDTAYAAEEPIVVTLWQPHWAYGAYELKNLEDPEGTLGEAEEIHNLATAGFAAEFPEVAEALGNFTMNDTQLADLETVALQDEAYADDVEAGVLAWLEDNKFDTLFK